MVKFPWLRNSISIANENRDVKKKKNVRESQASKRWLKCKTAGYDTWTLVRNGIKQDSVNVIMQSLIHIWKIIKKISLPLGRKPADWDFANVYFRAIRGDFWTTKSKNKQTNECTKRNEKIEIRRLTKREVRFIQKWVWNVISSANHTGRTNKQNDHPV